ncbi:MAG: general secretion pathway protein GspK [Kiritimatiellae bacterium]|nr:general secretion pathway protein GspK [Kiritimatiellia bacterium]
MRGGSVLIAALVSVAVAALFAVGAATLLRAATYEVGERLRAASDSRAAFECIDAFARDVLLCDTNGIDHLLEPWRLPYPAEPSPGQATLAPEFPSGDDDAFHPCADEESRLPLNSAPEEAIAALISSCAGRPAPEAAAIAAELALLRPFQRREFALRAPSMSPEIYGAIAPFVTAAPTEAVNLNTAQRQVLEAVFAAAGEFGSGAARSLARKIIDFRLSGGHFESLDAASLGAALGGINQAEAEALLAAAGTLSVESRHFSAVARRGAASIAFTFDRHDASFRRIAVSR